MRFTENRIESSKDELSLSGDLPPQPKVQSQDMVRLEKSESAKNILQIAFEKLQIASG